MDCKPKVSAVIVTRGDVDLKPVLATIEADQVIVKVSNGCGVWPRYEAMLEAKHQIVYTQDDDAIVDYRRVVECYEHGKVTCNMPIWKRYEYPDGIALVGWGAVFDVAAPLAAFQQYRRKFEDDAVFRRECDRVVTGLNPLRLIDVPFRSLAYAKDPNRLAEQPEHGAMLREIRRRIQVVRQG